MDAQLKAKWIEGLRSGEFKQADGILHDKKEEGYCCLGVLCKVMGAEFGSVVNDEGEEYDHVPHMGDRILSDGANEELNPVLARQLGIPQLELVRMNDGNLKAGIRKHSFAEIADYIEKNL